MDGAHYLDDFLLFERHDSSQCVVALQRAWSHYQTLDVPVAPKKTEGPGTLLVFLSIEIDTLWMSL